MKRRLVFLVSMIAATAVAAGAEPTAKKPDRLPDKPKFHVYLLMGQSNMAGRGKVDPADNRPDPRILLLDKSGQWIVAVEPLHWDKSIAGAGLGTSFAREMARQHPDVTVGLVPCAVGGSPLKAWQQDGALHKAALTRARQAANDGTLKGILWHQGESDANDKDAPTYAERLTAAIAAFRSELALPDLPVVVGGLGDFLVKRQAQAGRINESLQAVARSVPRVAFVTAAGLGHKGDSVHFDTPALREFGIRYARAMEELQKAGATQ